MINEIDIKDWQMLTEPLQLKDIKINEVFSFENSTELLESYGSLGRTVIAGLFTEDGKYAIPFTLPDFLKVYKWQKLA